MYASLRVAEVEAYRPPVLAHGVQREQAGAAVEEAAEVEEPPLRAQAPEQQLAPGLVDWHWAPQERVVAEAAITTAVRR